MKYFGSTEIYILFFYSSFGVVPNSSRSLLYFRIPQIFATFSSGSGETDTASLGTSDDCIPLAEIAATSDDIPEAAINLLTSLELVPADTAGTFLIPTDEALTALTAVLAGG